MIETIIRRFVRPPPDMQYQMQRPLPRPLKLGRKWRCFESGAELGEQYVLPGNGTISCSEG